MSWVGLIGTFLSLMRLVSDAAGDLSKYVVGYEVEFFYAIGALLIGVGMLTLGIAVFVARKLAR